MSSSVALVQKSYIRFSLPLQPPFNFAAQPTFMPMRNCAAMHFNDSLLIEQFTGMPGRYVRLRNTLLEFCEILGRTNDHVPEQAFYIHEE